MSNTNFTPGEEIQRAVMSILDKDGKLHAVKWLRDTHGIPLEIAKGYCDKLQKLPDYYPYYNDPEIIAALRPFAELAKAVLDICSGSNDGVIGEMYGVEITLGDCSNLLTALSKAEGTNK